MFPKLASSCHACQVASPCANAKATYSAAAISPRYTATRGQWLGWIIRSNDQNRHGQNERTSVPTTCLGSQRSGRSASTHHSGTANCGLSSSLHSKKSPHSVQVPSSGQVSRHAAIDPRRS
ncbi:MAG: hypothetical protein ACYSWT_11235 [Planctomycetota bacterium]|jgi:hypothetical protein